MTPDWIGAFVVGLIGAGHCMGMCGGIASLLSIGNSKPSPVIPLLYNLGRLLSYAVIGGVIGGATRSESVRRGLAAVPPEATVICVHDAARPFATEHLYMEVIAQVHLGADGAVPALAVTDTIKQVDASNVVVHTPDRSSLVAVQTPQAFRASALRTAHASSPEGTDDATLLEVLGRKVVVVAGEMLNRKLTAPEDLEWARATARTEV